MDNSKWQPIETAPDGVVLLYCEWQGHLPEGTRKNFIVTGLKADDGERFLVNYAMVYIRAKVLYWQPLPELMK